MRVNEVIITRIDGASGQHRDQLNDALVEAAAGGPWPKLMLMSWAASGVAETIRAATEAANAVTRTQRPRASCIRSCLPDGPTNSPFPDWSNAA
jgi:hypothetical protein